MRIYYVRALFVGTAIAFALLTGCETLTTSLSRKYEVAAYKPRNPDDVRVKVSLQSRMVYVMEGNARCWSHRPRLGNPAPQPRRDRIMLPTRFKRKRSMTYGFWARGNDVRPGTSDHSPGSGYHYVGYPMAYWVEFKPAYGFHQGAVWPIPHSHGCLRLHPNAAPKFFALVHVGTPVYIAQTQPEDETIGKTAPRPADYTDPDPPATYMVSDAVFAPPQGPLLLDQ